MPWIQDKTRPEPIQMTGETPPNPMRTWKNDAMDAIPIFLGIAAVIIGVIFAPRYLIGAKELIAKFVSELRTPVK